MSADYDQFIASKQVKHQAAGFECPISDEWLFDWQREIVAWALGIGKAAIFAECGLGKTRMQLRWADAVARHTGKRVLILAPLAVGSQTQREANEVGVEALFSQTDNGHRITITNYERLDAFDGVEFGGVVLDESSILKSYTGKLRRALTDRFASTPFRLCCTATPSPNDFTELGQHADFLGVCSPAQMLATFFINDTFDVGTWRLKGHSETQFWQWLASWACCVRNPEDLGYDHPGFDLPPLNHITEVVDVDEVTGAAEGDLFRHATMSATTMHAEMRRTSPARAARVAQIVARHNQEPWIVWCNTNDEADHLKRLIPGAIEVRGSDSADVKLRVLEDFSAGKLRVLITKPSIAGFGLNWQHCAHVVFVGLSYSFEDYYQAIRRTWRFGQKRAVNAHIVQSTTEGAVVRAIEEKLLKHEEMHDQMRRASRAFRESHTRKPMMKTDIVTRKGDGWTMHHGDCVRVARTVSDASIDFCVFSPPFADLFTYSDDLQDMGNCRGLAEFTEHFSLLIAELARIMVPGREVAVHCVDLLSTKWKHGRIEFQDFSGEIIRAFWRHGFLFHSRICIWKSPVTEMQRTKAHGLLHKTLIKDSSSSRVGSADYLLIFRTPGESARPVVKDRHKYPVEWWQEVASPVWMTVDQGRVLQGRETAREEKDERHICPLQLDVIDRAIELWSMEGDLVYSPFAGIGSEGDGALRMGRRFVGSELKATYFQSACVNLKNAKAQIELEISA